jgi:N-glycosylase/DNA lyase
MMSAKTHPLSLMISGLIEDARAGIIQLPEFSPITAFPKVWEELAFCVAASQERASRARIAAKTLSRAPHLSAHVREKDVPQLIAFMLDDANVRLRFHNRKVDHLSQSLIALRRSAASFMAPSRYFETEEVARQFVIESFSGLGPKQASMFLRNIGYGHSLAVIDTHVSWAIEIAFGLDDALKSPRQYFEAERALRCFADAIEFSMASLDVVLWSAARAYRRAIHSHLVHV